jgi:putative membrane protein
MKRLTFDALLAATMMIGPVAWAGTAAPGSDEKVMVPDTNSPSATGAVPAQSQKRERNTTPATTPTPTTPDDPERTTGRTNSPPGTQTAPEPTNPQIPAPTDTPRVPGATAGAEGDLDVVARVHQSNQKEIEMAQIALDKAESPQVKAYARKLLNDHQGADKKLLTYADKKNLDRSKLEKAATGTAAAPTADNDAQTRLLSATGADFDRQFVTVMLGEHDKAIDLVKSAKDSVTDRELRTFLAGVLPKLEQHRKMASELADKLSKS